MVISLGSSEGDIREAGKGVGGAGGARTPDLRLAKAALSQLSYGPTMVGDGGLEPPTSVLSGPRSNQLS